MSSPHRVLLCARIRSPRLLFSALASSLLLAAAFATSAPAATTPQAATSCNGSLSHAPTAEEPNLLRYKFHCDWGISAYTLVVNRQRNDFSTVDDFSTTANVLDTSGNVVPTESFGCEGNFPGNGINCNAGAGSYMAAPNYSEGAFDTASPYCSTIPSGSPAGTKPEPAAMVQLVVTDTTGAQDGPFRLNLTRACPPPPKPTNAVSKNHKRHQHRRSNKSRHR